MHTLAPLTLFADSDYFIFPADCLGYVPVSTIEHSNIGLSSLDLAKTNLPLETRFKAYRHTDVAALLALPPRLLPLAALVGNDHSDYLTTFSAVPWQSPNPRYKARTTSAPCPTSPTSSPASPSPDTT